MTFNLEQRFCRTSAILLCSLSLLPAACGGAPATAPEESSSTAQDSTADTSADSPAAESTKDSGDAALDVKPCDYFTAEDYEAITGAKPVTEKRTT
jgi:hypothetical protein